MRDPILIHCSYHKCLTSYFAKVAGTLYNRFLRWSDGYTHFNSRIEEFNQSVGDYEVQSVNNHVIDLDRFERVRVTRFIRDPRDMVVSGYYYHKRGAEAWCNIADPVDADWRVVNGKVPEGLEEGESYSDFLQRVSLSEGLRAEIEFRSKHFESMRRWPEDQNEIMVLAYEDILGNERDTFRMIWEFYERPIVEQMIAEHLGYWFSASRRAGKVEHIRNPNPSQWRDVFPPGVASEFDRDHGDILDRYEYPRAG